MTSGFADTLRRWVAALLDGDRAGAAACLSPAFGTHEGMGRDAYLAHELAEFARRREGFALGPGFDVLPGPAAAGLTGFLVVNARGQLTYEDALRHDGDGLIVGSGRPLEAVTKLAFEAGVPTRRAVALRSHGAPIRAAAVMGEASGDPLLDRGLGWDDDGFHTFSFTLPGDGLLARPARLRVVTAEGGATLGLMLRGTDHPFFVPGLLPEVRGAEVRLDPGRCRLWSLTVRLRDGTVATVDCPSREAYRFAGEVEVATVTDAVDNDWTTRA